MTQIWMSLLMLGACIAPDEPGVLVPKTVEQDDSLPRIELAGVKFHSEAFGDPEAPIVMVLHGGPGSDYAALLPLRALAADGFRVVFWDQRGAGLSQRFDASTYSTELYLEDLRLVVEHYTVRQGQPLVFIGKSWGAMYATSFINAYGDYGGRVRGAVLSDPGAFNGAQLEPYLDRLNEGAMMAEQLHDSIWARQFLSATEHEREDYLLAMLAFHGRPVEHVDPDKQAPFRRKGGVVQNAMLSMVRETGFDFTANLGRFSPKVLFLRGGLNEATPLWHQEELASSYPKHEIISLANTGHEMIWEQPEAYLAHTRVYLAEIGFTGVAP